MDRYQKLFSEKSDADHRSLAFCPFAVMGDPNYEKSLERVLEYVRLGADLLELGLPFSDPVADGPVIQMADKRALDAGMTTKRALELCAAVRQKTEIPIGLLVYFNPIFQYGIEKFYREAKKAGVMSVLVADLPLEEYSAISRAAKKSNIHPIFIVSERTTPERLKKITQLASGFLYVVSVLGTTGERKKLPASLLNLLALLKKQTKLPLMVGFGISRPEHIAALKKTSASGAIVGSGLVKFALSSAKKMASYFSNLKRAC